MTTQELPGHCSTAFTCILGSCPPPPTSHNLLDLHSHLPTSHTFPHLPTPSSSCMHAHVCPRDQNHFSHMWPRACCCCMQGGGGGRMASMQRPQPLEKWRPQPLEKYGDRSRWKNGDLSRSWWLERPQPLEKWQPQPRAAQTLLAGVLGALAFLAACASVVCLWEQLLRSGSCFRKTSESSLWATSLSWLLTRGLK